MKRKIRAVLLACALVISFSCICGCAKKLDPFEKNDRADHTVSVRFDANGGDFSDGMSTYIITDSFDISEMSADGEGNVNIPIISPDNSARGKNNCFEVKKAGYFLAGWYENREETGEKDKNGNPVYRYSEKWDFEEDRLSVEKDGKYSSAKPCLTLYAAWVPLYETRFYSICTDSECESYGELELMDTERFNPLTKGSNEIEMPEWSERSGCQDLNDIPKKQGYTFVGAYYDSEFTKPVTVVEGVLLHPGTLDEDNCESADPVLDIYIDWKEGEEFHIYTADQFVKNVSANGTYEIMQDLDFERVDWLKRGEKDPAKSFALGEFCGTINGNGYTFKNISFTQTDNKLFEFGLFASIGEGADINDLKFENVTLTVSSGLRTPGATLGLLAGTISENANVSGVEIIDSRIVIASTVNCDNKDVSYGLVCGYGESSGVVNADIECTLAENATGLILTVDEDYFTVEKEAADKADN